MLALTATLFSACSDDDDDDKIDDYAQQIAATYNGDLEVKIDQNTLPAIKKDVVVTRTELNKVKVQIDNLQIPQFDEEGQPTDPADIGTVIIEGIAVTKSGNDIKLAETSKPIEITMLGIKIPIIVKISGTHASSTLKLAIGVDGGEFIKQVISASFSGTKK